ncbi:MAG: MCE family protein [Methylococcales bacterium]|nr:MCE family protein [Methylococcales bacterium]
MSKEGNPTKIGAFIVGAIILLIISILIFSSDSFFSKNQQFIVVFSESINGLTVGAPIKLYGVQIGHVTEIKVERDKETNKTLIPVIFEVNPTNLSNYVNTHMMDWEDVEVDKLINSGLRMQLQLGSLLTGQLFIEALFLPETPIKLSGHKTDLKEIPSIPSNSDEIQKTIRNILENSKSIDLAELFDNLQKTASNLEQITGSEQTKSTLSAINISMLDLQQIMRDLKGDTSHITQDINKTINHADQLIVDLRKNTGSLLKDTHHLVSIGKTTLDKIDTALTNVESLIDNNSPVSQDLQKALQELARAARSTRIMMEYLERHPDALIYGKDAESGERK